MKRTTSLITALSSVAILTLVACKDTTPEAEPPATATEGETSSAAPARDYAELEAFLLADEPAEAVTVLEARKAPLPGSEIVLTGRIAGSREPFAAGFASLMMVDDSVETCDMIDDDHCDTPWDACCEDPDKLKAGRLSIQLTDAEGQPIPQGLKGVAGMKELDAITVIGTVAEGSNAENLVINATGIYRKEPASPAAPVQP